MEVAPTLRGCFFAAASIFYLHYLSANAMVCADMNSYLIAIISILILFWLKDIVLETLNLRRLREEIPGPMRDVFDEKRYRTSQQYLRTNTRFGLIQETVMLPLTLAFILGGGFRWFDALARSAGGGMIPTGLLFGGMLTVLYLLVQLPFNLYDTFVIEERFGFNKTTPKTFVLDMLKSLLLLALIGAPVFALVLWFFSALGRWAWLVSWGALTVIQLFLAFIAPIVILPLFNKFTPLEEGSLREKIEAYAHKQAFRLKGIFKIDGSRRSTKSNAYFTGFGKAKRIALFDTLIEKHSDDELVSVLAHEVGHCKRGHVRKLIGISILSSGIMLFLLQLFISRPGLYEAFGLTYRPVDGQPPIYAGFIFFGFLYTPISFALSIAVNALSRRYEYEADRFAAETTEQPRDMISALKKLSADNLSNLTPHPVKVALEYSHPPVLKRLEALQHGNSKFEIPKSETSTND